MNPPPQEWSLAIIAFVLLIYGFTLFASVNRLARSVRELELIVMRIQRAVPAPETPSENLPVSPALTRQSNTIGDG